MPVHTISATRAAIATAAPGDLVCVTGSLYLVGEVRRLGVHLREAGAADARVVVGGDQRGQFGRVAQPAGVRTLIPRICAVRSRC